MYILIGHNYITMHGIDFLVYTHIMIICKRNITITNICYNVQVHGSLYFYTIFCSYFSRFYYTGQHFHNKVCIKQLMYVSKFFKIYLYD